MKDIYEVEEYDLCEQLKTEIDEKSSAWSKKEKERLYEIFDQDISEDELKWGAKEKADYIYIRLCQIFNYDERYAYSYDASLKDDIFDKRIDPHHVNTSKVVCSSFSRLFLDICDELLCLDMDYVYGELVGELGHMYTRLYFSEFESTYDPILSKTINDFVAAKKDMIINGIYINPDIMNYEDGLRQEESFRRIGYFNLYDEYLSIMYDVINNSEMSNSELFEYIFNSTDFTGLGLYESMKLLNKQCKDLIGKSLKDIGVKLDVDVDSLGKPTLTYSFEDEKRYKVSEKDGKIDLLDIKQKVK